MHCHKKYCEGHFASLAVGVFLIRRGSLQIYLYKYIDVKFPLTLFFFQDYTFVQTGLYNVTVTVSSSSGTFSTSLSVVSTNFFYSQLIHFQNICVCFRTAGWTFLKGVPLRRGCETVAPSFRVGDYSKQN